MVNHNIYNVNWKKLLLWLIPGPLRRVILLRWLTIITGPVQALYSALMLYKGGVKYWLGINSQVCYMEKMLNDRYDATMRRIYIERPPSVLPLYVYLRSELKPVYIFKNGEGNIKYLFTKGETVSGGVDFYVVVPKGLSANFIEMNVLIEKNKLPAKEHAIKII